MRNLENTSLETKASNQVVEEILSSIGELAAMPQVVYKVIELTASTNTSAQEIENAISIDPGFSSKVLILVNSAFYALPRKVTSIREAATFLGYKTIRQLALTVGVFDMFVGKNDIGSLRRRTWWRHSVDTAVCARSIAQHLTIMNQEDAYSCGLLHDIGKSLMDRYNPELYIDVEKLIEEGYDNITAERQVFGCTHEEVGKAAALNWHLPAILCESIGAHHSGRFEENPESVALTSLASDYAHAILSGRKTETDDELQQELLIGKPWALEILKIQAPHSEKLYQVCKHSLSVKTALSA